MRMNEPAAICIDVGNTSMKVVMAGTHGIEVLGSEPTSRPQSSVRIKKLLKTTRRILPDSYEVNLCTVVPEMGTVMRDIIKDSLGVRPFMVRHTCRFPFKIGLKHPAKVGPDRLCAAAGVFAGRAGARIENAIIVDVGSAVTVDLIRRGRFRGGLIFVGPVLGLRALGEYARRLPHLDPLRMESTLDNRFGDTEPSMALGARVSSVGAIKQAVDHMQRVSRCRPSIYLTGGWAPVLLEHFPGHWRYRAHLVTEGMIVVRDLNR